MAINGVLFRAWRALVAIIGVRTQALMAVIAMCY